MEEDIHVFNINEIDNKLKEGIKLNEDEASFIRTLLETHFKINEMLIEYPPIYGTRYNTKLVSDILSIIIESESKVYLYKE
jgi:hypothetical protein